MSGIIDMSIFSTFLIMCICLNIVLYYANQANLARNNLIIRCKKNFFKNWMEKKNLTLFR